MSGKRKRCFYCSDSRGADIEHFAPLSPYYCKTFVWDNLLLVCAECNRKKANRFRGSLGAPLLDPTVDEPWNHFFLDTATGHLSPRFIQGVGPDPKATATLEVLDVLLDEAVAEGRAETIRRVRDAVFSCLDPTADRRKTHQRLLTEVKSDFHGITVWFTQWEGQAERAFATLKSDRPQLWRRIAAASTAQQYGA